LPSGIGCSLRGSLRTADGRRTYDTFEGQIVPGENLFTGTQGGYSVLSGDYIVDVNSDRAWTITVLPAPA